MNLDSLGIGFTSYISEIFFIDVSVGFPDTQAKILRIDYKAVTITTPNITMTSKFLKLKPTRKKIEFHKIIAIKQKQNSIDDKKDIVVHM